MQHFANVSEALPDSCCSAPACVCRSLPRKEPQSTALRLFRWEVIVIDETAELLTLFFETEEFPLISVVRDTLGSDDPDVHRLRYVWTHTYATPSLQQRLASGGAISRKPFREFTLVPKWGTPKRAGPVRSKRILMAERPRSCFEDSALLSTAAVSEHCIADLQSESVSLQELPTGTRLHSSGFVRS